ncbi:DEKNAAC100440 [Brettanomyces naardenensis]|uniref:RNA helicase n=1 Tax=Brettanomyces naardenensis TaxID=13370 RepID=A0A448YG67_BRENA|nr:DEKNAAC100440 [Brettanomyces naardenensis]
MKQNKKIRFDEDEGPKGGEGVNTKNKEWDLDGSHANKRSSEMGVGGSDPKQPRRNGRKIVNFDSDDEDEDEGEDEDQQHNRRTDYLKIKMKARTLLEDRKKLPVYKVKDRLVPKIISSRVSIVIGETGSGKSTQIPQFLMKRCKGAIAVTEPRRVGAINLATRVAEEYGCIIGREVGYSVRFSNATSRKTRLKYMTDGMLLREMMLDPTLSKYSMVVVDEAHERTILTDMMLGLLKQLVTDKRKHDSEFRIVVMSATLDADKFSHFFDNAPIYFIEGRMFPVERLYLQQSVDDITDAMVKAIIGVNQGERAGDILCFLPGQDDIDKVTSLLKRLAPELPKEAPLIIPLPLYAALPPAQQMKVFERVKPSQRKVILSTNISETSVTVPGIRFVIDSGLRKVKVWRHELGLSTLLTVPISKASASQRTGRAGREAPGKCFRLYKESDYIKLIENTEPEILRSEIVSPVLMLKRLNVENILGWNWLENPGREALSSALQQLYSLNALSDTGKITDMGRKMVVLPVAPHLAAVLIQAREYDVLDPVIDIVSCLSVDTLVLTPANDRRDEINAKRRDACTLGSHYGDLLMLKELFDIYNGLSGAAERKSWCKDVGVSYKGFKNVLRIRKQIQGYMQHIPDDLANSEDQNQTLDASLILKSFLKGFVTNTAIGMPDRSYRTVTTGDTVSVHPSSLLFGKKLDAIMYIEHVYTAKGYARNVSSIELDWLQEVAPHYLGLRVNVES